MPDRCQLRATLQTHTSAQAEPVSGYPPGRTLDLTLAFPGTRPALLSSTAPAQREGKTRSLSSPGWPSDSGQAPCLSLSSAGDYEHAPHPPHHHPQQKENIYFSEAKLIKKSFLMSSLA